MSAGTLNIRIEQGSDFLRTLTIKDSADAAVNLTGYSFEGQIRKTYADPNVIASFTMTLLDQTSLSTKGQVTMTLSDTVTAAIAVDAPSGSTIKPTIYFYDVLITDPSGNVERMIEGLAKVYPGVTR